MVERNDRATVLKELFATGKPVYGYCSDHGRGGTLNAAGFIEHMPKAEGVPLFDSLDRVCVAGGKWIGVPRAVRKGKK